MSERMSSRISNGRRTFRHFGTSGRGPSRRESSVAIRVLIVDDHPFMRDALENLLATCEDIRVVGVCADGNEVASMAGQTAPDVVLMDLDMPQMSGLEATQELRAQQPQVRVVILTGACTSAVVREAEALGVAGFLLKGDEDPADLPQRIRAVAAGGTAWCELAAKLAS
jgi:DNA-binding NarL/FixJ family response regulator